MEKEKEKKEVLFNPADYDYMKKMSYDGWMWEFIRRSENYNTAINQYKLLKNSRDKYTVKQLIQTIHSLKIYCNERVKTKIHQETHFIFSYEKRKIGIPKPDIKYCDFSPDMKPLIRGIFPIRVKTLNELSDAEKGRDVLGRISPMVALEETLYIGIPIKAKLDNVRKYLPVEIKKYLKPEKSRIRDDKWKYYLIVYDLKRKYPNIAYKDIANALQDAYPNACDKKKNLITFDEKNCENYYKKAEELINSDYQKYTYTPSS